LSKTNGSLNTFSASVDEQGRLVLPTELANRFGFAAGTSVLIDEEINGLHFHRPTASLAKVYIEPTSQCNLNCRICIRNIWNEPMGQMSSAIFERLISGIKSFESPPAVFFGGFGEPLSHHDIVEMVSAAKTANCRVELITNGTLLTPKRSRALINAGLDMLWVSLDGATPESYEDVRLGAELSTVLQNIENLRAARRPGHRPAPEIGISFVAMKRNIHDLPALLRLRTRLGASRFLVTNLLPYSRDMCAEILYSRVLHDIPYIPSIWVPDLDLPRMDENMETQEVRHYTLRGGCNLSYNGDNLGRANDRCPFIGRGATAITWDGNLSPCLPLMHSYESYLNNRPRFSHRYIIGNLAEKDFTGLWNSPDYMAFRKKIQEFNFSPCTICGGCDLSEENKEDCYGNTFPTCGGCLWPQGVIQCP
jgi:MoaA/NifB/PqqE/SkfB family radical SAM enzyme